MTDQPFHVYVIQGRGERDYADCQAAIAHVPARMTSLSFIATEDEVIARARDADAMVVVSSPVTRTVMSALEGLKTVVRTGVGYDVIDVPAATELGVIVVNIPDLWVREVANHALALLLAAVATQSGVLLGASSGIKIAPLPLTPFFLIDMSWRRRFLFLTGWLLVLAAIFAPAVMTGGWSVLHNIFTYAGTGYEWGFCGLGYLSGSFLWAQLYSHYGRFVVIAALVALFILFYRRPAPLPAMIGIALLTMDFFSPAFGVWK